MPFSSATTGRDFFCAHSPKRQFHRLPFEKDYGQKVFFTGYHLKGNSSVQGTNMNIFSGGI